MTRPFRPQGSRRRGFATLVALIALSFIGVTVAAMSTYFAFQARRSSEAAAGAQQRQLLLAAAQMAPRLAAANTSGRTVVAVPVDNATLEINMTIASPRATAQVTLTLPRTRATQTLTLENTDNRWRIIAAQ